LIPNALHPATTHGHMGGPRLYDTLANVFFFGRRRATFLALIVAAGVQPGQRVLDVGCGTGYFVRLLAQAVGPQGLVIGIDPSPAMISYASRNTGRAGNCQFQVGTAGPPGRAYAWRSGCSSRVPFHGSASTD
jgi:SAM-dependent methyltransferase